ncbi:MAG: sigma-70 family RNA polymerase sigma factor [Aeromicrobium sp.]
MGEEEFAEVYSRLREPIFRFAIGRLSPEQAKDVVSDTFEVVWRKRRECPADPSEWPAWIVGIARKKILQEIDRVARKHHDGRFIADQSTVVEAIVTADVADTVTASDAGRWVWNQLTPAERELLDLAFIDRIDRAQAARILGLTPTAYATRLTRLRQRIIRLDADSAGTPTIETTGGTP